MKSSTNVGHVPGSFSGFGGGELYPIDNAASGGLPTKGGRKETAALNVTAILQLQLEEHTLFFEMAKKQLWLPCYHEIQS